MPSSPHAARSFHHVPPHAMRRPPVELHVLGCDCSSCEPYAPSAAPQLTSRQIVTLAAAGIAAGHLVAFAIDPAGTIAIAADLLRWWLS